MLVSNQLPSTWQNSLICTYRLLWGSLWYSNPTAFPHMRTFSFSLLLQQDAHRLWAAPRLSSAFISSSRFGLSSTANNYLGMACRLCFDLGLNLDWTQMGLSDREVQIRHMVLWACVVYDKSVSAESPNMGSVNVLQVLGFVPWPTYLYEKFRSRCFATHWPVRSFEYWPGDGGFQEPRDRDI